MKNDTHERFEAWVEREYKIRLRRHPRKQYGAFQAYWYGYQAATDDFDALLKSAREFMKIQLSNGNWNYDQYMHGMANGMILIMSIFDRSEPIFLKAPDIWLKDLSSPLETLSEADKVLGEL